jgi:copper resistance protein C
MTFEFAGFCKVAFTIGFGFIVSPSAVFAHAILVKSTPHANQTVSGPNVPLALSFNSRVDQARSTLMLERPDHSTSRVTVELDRSSPEKLIGRISSLALGAYKLRWQVLAMDGHITRGEITFQVK